MKLTVLPQAEAKGSTWKVLTSLELRLRHDCQLLALTIGEEITKNKGDFHQCLNISFLNVSMLKRSVHYFRKSWSRKRIEFDLFTFFESKTRCYRGYGTIQENILKLISACVSGLLLSVIILITFFCILKMFALCEVFFQNINL